MPINIVIPMAGLGSRFATAGYTTPKPLILIHGVPMIKAVVRNLTPVKGECHFTFLVLREHVNSYSVDQELQLLAPGCSVIPVDQVTEGAACTVLLAREVIDNDWPMMIANSDQFVDIDIDRYLIDLDSRNLDGLIMTFRNDHPKWSYCRMNQDGTVAEVVEKQVVSNEATVGIYNFRRGCDFVSAADHMILANKRVNGEFYVAPVYNELIAAGGRVGVFNIGEEGVRMHGLGTPDDLEKFLSLSKYKDRIHSWD
jgi:dTDP-glucose pyrophosphorylase